MPVQPVLILTFAAVAANIVLLSFMVIRRMVERPSRIPREAEAGEIAVRQAAEAAVVGGLLDAPRDDGAPASAYDRIVRIVSWIFLLSTATIVAATGLWTDNQPAIFALLAFGGVFVVIVHDLLPPDRQGSSKFVADGCVAITVATLLVALTGGVFSPFFFAFPLIVAAGALVVAPSITVGLAGAATLGYVLAVVAGTPSDTRITAAAATVGVNLTALILLAFAAMVIAREQRRTRLAAIRLSTVDSLTGLFNRTFFFAAIGREIARCARTGRGFSLLMMDLDDLKAINDRLGHHHGDRILRGVGGVVADRIRRIDTAARYGGDEFVVLLPETDPTGAYVLAEKIRLGVNAMAIDQAIPRSHPSVSIGVVNYPADGRTADELMISADEAMYTSKRGGKDRVTGLSIPVMGPIATLRAAANRRARRTATAV